MELNGVKVIDTFAECFDGLFVRLIVTAHDRRLLERAVFSATALPSTVFGEAEGGVERWLAEEETPDGRPGAVIQLWVSYSKKGVHVLEREVGKRVRQGILVVPSTRVFNGLESEDTIDTMERIGHCGDGYETVEDRFGREMILIPIMMGEFLIEKRIGYAMGIAGGNIWIFCDSLESGLHAGEAALEAVERVPFTIAPFGICSAGSKVETNYPDIGPTTNHLFCPTLKGSLPVSQVPDNVRSIPEIVINGKTIGIVEEAMKRAVYAVKDVDGVLFISAGNFGGKLGKYKIFLKDLLY